MMILGIVMIMVSCFASGVLVGIAPPLGFGAVLGGCAV